MNIPLFQNDIGPLGPEPVQRLNEVLASLNPEQKAWLCGYFAAINQMEPGASALPQAVAAVSAASPVTVLFGSQTGNGEKVARQLAQALKDRGVPVALKDMASYKTQQLKHEQTLCVVISTHGKGDPPDNAMDLHAFLLGKRAPRLENTAFAVLALGDTIYEHFCKTGADFDTRLGELSGKRILDRVDCDVDYEDKAAAWIVALAEKIGATRAAAAPAVATVTAPSAAIRQYDKKHPFLAPLAERILLNGRGSSKETWHLELLIEGSGLHYEPGDVLGVMPSNDPKYVDKLIRVLGADAMQQVSTPRGQESLRNVLIGSYEVTTITRPFLRGYAEYAQSKQLDAMLGDTDQLNHWLYGRELIDVLSTWPVKGLALPTFLDMLRKLPPRLYSIASCLEAHPDEVHLCVGATRYEAHGRQRNGVCSTYLAERIAMDEMVPVYVDANKNFKLPASLDTPVIMVGPGTGIAPFRAFVEAREIQGGGRNWLFFGDQHFDTDFLYQIEWQDWLKSGVLSRMDVAFSRDQDDKLYVQHRMREKARELYAWMQDGAHVYVCGDENRMARDVHEALIEIAREQGALTREQAEAYVKTLQKDRRYQRDVY